LESIPGWARASLDSRRAESRPFIYAADEFESARTHDPVWNAAQRQLVAEGRLHNYLRMLWGKKVIEWSATPGDAFATLVRLNDSYAVDGRDPNSYGGILWCFGRFDRPWGPARPVFGTVRFMSSDAARRKLEMDEYLRRFGDDAM
jgi:deoxyribodipyrimidine photo-lyase